MFTDYNDDTIIDLDKILSYIKYKDAEIKQMQFERECMVDKYCSGIESLYLFPYMVKEDFYRNVLNYVSKKSDKSDEYDLLLEQLRSYIPDIKEFTEAIMEGYDFHGLDLRFAVNGAEYEIYLPIIANINKENIVYKNTREINTDIAKISIFKKTGKHSWSRIYCGYEMNKDKIREAIYG